MQGFETAPTQSSEGNDVSSSEGQLESTGQVDRNGELASWEAQIQARIQRSWLRPPSAHSGIDCIAYVTQVPGGEVTNVRLGQCNGDATVRASIQAAAYRASPLPPPPDPALFQRDLEIQFKPVD
jgi:colicin import membrane protein